VQTAKRRTFGVIAPAAIPPGERTFAAHAAAAASRDAFHVAVGIGAALLVLTGLGGVALEGRRRSPVTAGDCAGGSLSGAPRAAADCGQLVPAGVPVAGDAVPAGAASASAPD
jgi:hypothetical protein